jgi:multidrug efflux pump
MLTLYTTPVVYLYLDRFSMWLRSMRGPSPHALPRGRMFPGE